MNPVDYEYYEWLISQIDSPRGKTYNGLFECMHNVEFVWTLPNDDNRLNDALELRHEFLHARRAAHPLQLQGATLLEVLVSLSRRVAFITDGNSKQWAWRLLKNLHLNKMCDPLTEEKKKRIYDILDSLIWRTYERDGQGGFFPLQSPLEDQTKVEIWYQMNKYVMEMEEI